MATITALGWVLSYVSLRALALAYGEAPWAATLWPATIDLFALVAGVTAIRARGEGRPDRYAEALALIYSATAIAGNAVMARDPLGMVVHGVPAATMVLGWHLLLRRARPGRQMAMTGADASAAAAAAERPGPALDALAPSEGGLGHDVAPEGDMAVESGDMARRPAAVLAMTKTKSWAMSGESAAMATRRAAVLAMADTKARSMTPDEARRALVELVREARARDGTVSTAEAVLATGRGRRQARRMLNAAMAELDTEADQAQDAPPRPAA